MSLWNKRSRQRPTRSSLSDGNWVSENPSASGVNRAAHSPMPYNGSRERSRFLSKSEIPIEGAIRQRRSARGRYDRRNSSRRMRSSSRSMMGKALIRYELRVRPLVRAISPGRSGMVEGGTWRFLGLCIRVAPDDGVTGDNFLAEIPADMIVAWEKSSRHPRIPTCEV